MCNLNVTDSFIYNAIILIHVHPYLSREVPGRWKWIAKQQRRRTAQSEFSINMLNYNQML